MTLDELKMLLALNGNQRIPYAEEEIFADKILYKVYLVHLRHCVSDLVSFEEDIEVFSWLAFEYARMEIKGRWPEAETIIVTNAQASAQYAYEILCCRFAGGEEAISKDAWWAYWYAEEVIGGRFLEAEEVISNNPYYSCQYNDRFGTTI
jgi:hypothetical protein